MHDGLHSHTVAPLAPPPVPPAPSLIPPAPVLGRGSGTGPRRGRRAGGVLVTILALVSTAGVAAAVIDVPSLAKVGATTFDVLAVSYDGAYVAPNDRNLSTWVLGVGVAADDPGLDAILIHEFGHLVTLSPDQLQPGIPAAGCSTYNDDLGCAKGPSTLAAFVEAFWSDALIAEAEEVEATGDDPSIVSDKYRDQFVTDYAAIDPAEDLAEVFTAFVLSDRPTGDTIADAKVDLLWQDPELVKLRTRIRANL